MERLECPKREQAAGESAESQRSGSNDLATEWALKKKRGKKELLIEKGGGTSWLKKSAKENQPVTALSYKWG